METSLSDNPVTVSWQSPLPLIPEGSRGKARKWKKSLSMQQHYSLQKYAREVYASVNASLRLVDDPRYRTLSESELENGGQFQKYLAGIKPLTVAEDTVMVAGLIPHGSAALLTKSTPALQPLARLKTPRGV